MRVILTGNRTLDALTVRGLVLTNEVAVIAKDRFEDAKVGVASKLGQARRQVRRVRAKTNGLRRKARAVFKRAT